MIVKGSRVYVSESEVSDFMSMRPCSNLKGTRLWFEFDSAGNLVDMGPGDTSRQDGPALLALSDNAAMILAARRYRDQVSLGRKHFDVWHIRINRQGYDASGCYWGVGAPLYSWESKTDSDSFGHIRASSRDDAFYKLAKKVAET